MDPKAAVGGGVPHRRYGGWSAWTPPANGGLLAVGEAVVGQVLAVGGSSGAIQSGWNGPDGPLEGGGGSLTPFFSSPPLQVPPRPPHRAKPPNRLSAWTPLANGEGRCPPPCVPGAEQWNRDSPGAALAQTYQGKGRGCGGVRVGRAGEREGTRC